METITKYDVKETTWSPKLLLAKRAKIAFDKLPIFFSEAYGSLYSRVEKLGLTSEGMPLAIYYDIDEIKKETDVAAAVAVKNKPSEESGVEMLTLPASKVVFTTHYGSYENMKPAYDELQRYLKEHSLKKKLIIEEYFSDPAEEKNPNKWKTNIYFVLR
jgi:effector-binding domain-containing protein